MFSMCSIVRCRLKLIIKKCCDERVECLAFSVQCWQISKYNAVQCAVQSCRVVQSSKWSILLMETRSIGASVMLSVHVFLLSFLYMCIRSMDMTYDIRCMRTVPLVSEVYKAFWSAAPKHDILGRRAALRPCGTANRRCFEASLCERRSMADLLWRLSHPLNATFDLTRTL